MTSRSAVKTGIRAQIESRRAELLKLSHRIHANPELGYAETRAAAWTSTLLENLGMDVERDLCGLPTAFKATAGSGALNIFVCAEYDALPDIGHACGHNIIAASAVGAAAGLLPHLDDLDLTVTVIGTPAEELGDDGGKIALLRRGGFDGAHAAMMVHPCPFDAIDPPLIAAATFDVGFVGREAHASAAPEKGINAGDAMTIAQVAIGLLRQHLDPGDLVHGVVLNAGKVPNIIPASAQARYTIRTATLARLEQLRDRVLACFRAASLATGAELQVSGGDNPFAEVIHDPGMVSAYAANARILNRHSTPEGALDRFFPSTDMGNVSQVIPSIHPYLGLDCLPVVNHQQEFAELCASTEGDAAVMDGAILMAWTAADVARDGELRARLLSADGTSLGEPTGRSTFQSRLSVR